MTEKFSPAHLDAIHEIIKTELLVRGFTAKTHFPPFENAFGNLSFETENFQTVPVMFRSNRIEIFSSTITVNHTFKGSFNVWFTVNIRHKHFSGGGSYTRLFDVKCVALSDGSVHSVNVTTG